MRTTVTNQLRGLLSDFGYIFPVAIKAFELGMRELETYHATHNN
jgi:hypothetical protein